jgi:hypothetical protein
MTFLGVPTALWGGIIGSTLTYLITFLRERRKLEDAHRAPQREALGEIIGAANELKVCASDMLDQAGLTGRQTSEDAALSSIRMFERALLDVERAFAVGRLTVVEASCYEQMMRAYHEYSRLRRSTNMAWLADSRYWQRFIKALTKHSDILDNEIASLVDISQDRLSPTQGWRNRLRMKVARANIEAKYPEEGNRTPRAPQSPGDSQG